MAQIEVVVPDVQESRPDAVEEPLGRRDNGVGPESNQPNAAGVALVKAHVSGIATAYLHGKTEDLRHQQGQQHHQIPIAIEERFHGNDRVQRSGFRINVEGSVRIVGQLLIPDS